MSQILQFHTGGFTSGSIAPDHYWNGLPTEADGTLAIDSGNPIVSYSQGLPMTATGRLATAIDGVIDHYGSGAAPFTAAGRLAVNVAGGAAVTFLAAVGYVAGGQAILTP